MSTRARTLALMALVVALTGCAGPDMAAVSVTTEDATPTAVVAPMDAFRGELQPVATDLGNGMRWIGGAAQSFDMADLRAACRSFDRDVERLEAVLPSPDAAVTQRLRGAVTDWREMAGLCQGASAGTDFGELHRLLDAGEAEFMVAVDLIKQAP